MCNTLLLLSNDPKQWQFILFNTWWWMEAFKESLLNICNELHSGLWRSNSVSLKQMSNLDPLIQILSDLHKCQTERVKKRKVRSGPGQMNKLNHSRMMLRGESTSSSFSTQTWSHKHQWSHQTADTVGASWFYSFENQKVQFSQEKKALCQSRVCDTPCSIGRSQVSSSEPPTCLTERQQLHSRRLVQEFPRQISEM